MYAKMHNGKSDALTKTFKKTLKKTQFTLNLFNSSASNIV